MSEAYRLSTTTTQQYGSKPKAPKRRAAQPQPKTPKLDREAMKKDR